MGTGLLLAMVILSVFFYNANVDLRYSSSEINSVIARLETGNAELSDKLYSKLDFENVEEVSSRLGLVKERAPEYLLALQ